MNKIQQKIEEYKRRIKFYERQEQLSEHEFKTMLDLNSALSDLKEAFKLEDLEGSECVKIFTQENRFVGYLSDGIIDCCSESPVWFESHEEAENYLHKSVIYLDSGDYLFEFELYKLPNINKFEYISTSKKDFNLPTRGTAHSAGYDFYSPSECTIKPNETKMISLDVKCQVKEGEFLMIVPRSSLGFKGNNHLMLTNTLGVIDKDYYNNTGNEGVICLKLHNFGTDEFVIHKNDRLVQGIFVKYDTTEDDNSTGKRLGGFGSTGK